MTSGSRVLPRVNTLRFCCTIAPYRDAINCSGGTPFFCKPLISVSANTPHFAATACVSTPSKLKLGKSHSCIFNLALILSITVPVPPAHLSFMLSIFLFEFLSTEALNRMILASCPPSSMTDPAAGCKYSTASDTAFTSCMKRAFKWLVSAPPPLPVITSRNCC